MMIHADSDIFTFRWHEKSGKSTLMAFIGLYVIVVTVKTVLKFIGSNQKRPSTNYI